MTKYSLQTISDKMEEFLRETITNWPYELKPVISISEMIKITIKNKDRKLFLALAKKDPNFTHGMSVFATNIIEGIYKLFPLNMYRTAINQVSNNPQYNPGILSEVYNHYLKTPRRISIQDSITIYKDFPYLIDNRYGPQGLSMFIYRSAYQLMQFAINTNDRAIRDILLRVITKIEKKIIIQGISEMTRSDTKCMCIISSICKRNPRSRECLTTLMMILSNENSSRKKVIKKIYNSARHLLIGSTWQSTIEKLLEGRPVLFRYLRDISPSFCRYYILKFHTPLCILFRNKSAVYYEQDIDIFGPELKICKISSIILLFITTKNLSKLVCYYI